MLILFFPKKEYYSSLVSSASDNPNLFGKQSTNSYTANPPHRYPPLLLALHWQPVLLLFFTGKISKLRLSLTSNPATSSPHSPSPPPSNFSVFTPASKSEVHKILSNCPNEQSESDPIPTWLLKECSSVLVPTVTNIVNLSLISGHFHATLKESVISPCTAEETDIG